MGEGKLTEEQIDEILRGLVPIRTQTGRKDFTSTGPSTIAIRDFLYISNVIRCICGVDEDGKPWPFFKTDGYQQNVVKPSSDADPWGPYLELNASVLYSAGTTITATVLTAEAGYEYRLVSIFSHASRAPDAAHRWYVTATVGGTADDAKFRLVNETTSVVAAYPIRVPTDYETTYAPIEGFPMYEGDELVFVISNNSVAGDTLKYQVLYQRRAVG